MAPFKILVDTNVLMSPLTFCILIYLDELRVIQINISQTVLNEYNLHNSKIPSSALKQYSDTFLDSFLVKTCNSPLLNKIKMKDKGDLHLIEYCIDQNIANILTFDKKAFYKSQLRKLNLSSIHPDIFLSNFLSINRINLKIFFEKLNLNTDNLDQNLRNANLTKLSKKINYL